MSKGHSPNEQVVMRPKGLTALIVLTAAAGCARRRPPAVAVRPPRAVGVATRKARPSPLPTRPVPRKKAKPKPYIHVMFGTESDPREGDIVDVEEFLMVLGPKSERNFVKSDSEGHEKLFVVDSRGNRRLVAVEVDKNYMEETEKEAVINPLKNLTRSQIRGLRGVRLHAWTRQVLRSLRRLDRNRVCISIAISMNPKARIPNLPDVRCLSIEEGGNTDDRFVGFKALGRSRNLEYFSLTGDFRNGVPFDVGLLKRNAGLRMLNITDKVLKRASALKRFRKLEELTLSDTSGFSRIGFAGRMAKLQELRIDRTGVRDISGLSRRNRELGFLDISDTAVADLRPIGRLKVLEEVEARRTAARWLPRRNLPKLRSLDIMDTRVTKAEFKRFRRQNPDCMVYRFWRQSLLDAIVGVDRIRVARVRWKRTGTVYRGKTETWFEEKDPAVIRRVIAHLNVIRRPNVFHMCRHGPKIQFFNGNKLLAQLTYSHGSSLEWGRWPGTAIVTADTRAFLNVSLWNKKFTGFPYKKNR